MPFEVFKFVQPAIRVCATTPLTPTTQLYTVEPSFNLSYGYLLLHLTLKWTQQPLGKASNMLAIIGIKKSRFNSTVERTQLSHWQGHQPFRILKTQTVVTFHWRKL